MEREAVRGRGLLSTKNNTKMKKTILMMAVLFVTAFSAHSQDVVKWSFSSKKIAEKTYELHLTASISSSWKIYSQKTPEGGPLPTKITFAKHPMLTVVAEAKEIGKLNKAHEEVFGVDVLYYKDKVDFVQIVKLKNKVKTVVSGTVEFMACDEKQCLPPNETPFKIALN